MSDKEGVLTKPTIAPELADLPHVPVDALEPLQGGLKELSGKNYEKLRNSISEHGLIVPFFVWKEADKLIDGHQRHRVMINEGWLMPVPVVYISAEDEQDAKRKLLVISSQYGRVTQDGWDDFTWDVPEAVEIAQFDALPFVFGEFGPTDAANDPWEEWEGMPEFENEDMKPLLSLRVHIWTQDDIKAFAELIGQTVTVSTKWIHFPPLDTSDPNKAHGISLEQWSVEDAE